MISRAVRTAIACVSLSICLAACAHSDGPAPVSLTAPNYRVTLPAPPAGLVECLKAEFPEIPARDLTTSDVVSLLGRAKVLDRRKSACLRSAFAWIDGVRRDLGR